MADAMTPGEAKRLLAAVGGGFVGLRDRAYLAMLFRCGMRNNEARMMDLVDLRRDQDPWSARIRFPKGVESGKGKAREIGVDCRTKELLENWIAIRGTRAGPLFHTSTMKRLQTSYMRRKVTALGKAAGIARRVHPHALRHAFARSLHDEGVPVRLIQIALGHASLNTTAVYLQSLGDPEVIAVTAKREW